MAMQVTNMVLHFRGSSSTLLQREEFSFSNILVSCSSYCVNSMVHQWRVTILYAVLIAVSLWMLLELWRQRGRKGPIRWPLLGAAVEVLWNYRRHNDWIVSYLKKSPTMDVELPHVTFTFTALPENVEHILKNNFSNYPKGELFHEAMDIFLGDGIFNTDGELWRKQRKTASFEFASKVLREFSTLVFRDYSLKLAAILNHASTVRKAVDMQDLFMRLTLDSICKISFGIEIGSLEPSLPDIPFAKAFETTNEIVSHRFMDPWWKLKRLFKVGTEATVIKSAKQVNDFTYNVIRTRRAEVAALGKSGEKVLAEGTVQSHVAKDLLERRDLFTRFLLLNEEEGGEFYTDKNLRDTMLNLVIAGRDTTAVTLSCTQKLPKKLKKSFAPLRNLRERNILNLLLSMIMGEFLTYDSLLKLQYLYAAILETLRLYPAVPMDPKCVLNDDVLPDGTRVKKGPGSRKMIMYSAYAMGRMEYLWGSDACEFKPSRWLKDGVVQLESPFKFTVFQTGPRICLGKDSAMLQLQMVLAILCRFYKFQLISEAPVMYRQMSILLVANGLHVTVTRKM